MNLRAGLPVLIIAFMVECAFGQNAAIRQRDLAQVKKELAGVEADIRSTQEAIAYLEAKLSQKPLPLLVLRAGYNDLERMNFRNPADQVRGEIRLKGLRGELSVLIGRAKAKSERIANLEASLGIKGGLNLPQQGSRSNSASSSGQAIDLIRGMAGMPNNVKGRWRIDDSGKLVSAKEVDARIEMSGLVPKNYRLTIKGKREEGRECLGAILVIDNKQVIAMIDGWGSTTNGLCNVDGLTPDQNASTIKKRNVLPVGDPFEVVYLVQNGRIEVQVNGSVLIDWRQGYDRLSLPTTCTMPSANQLGLIAFDSVFTFSSITLEPLSP